jgi:hypothetical protein
VCCRTVVRPLNPELVRATLTIGQFKPVYFAPDRPDLATRWEREVPEEGATVTAHVVNDGIELSISPAISHYDHHMGKRLAAGIYFEIAARYADKVNGTVVQRATVEGCTSGQNTKELLLASYPTMPLSFDRVCNGFQASILGEEYVHDHAA